MGGAGGDLEAQRVRLEVRASEGDGQRRILRGRDGLRQGHGAALAAIALEKREVSPVEIRVAVAVTAAWSPRGMAPLNTKGAWPDASVVTVCEPSRTLPAARSTSPSGSLGVEKYSMRMLSLATLFSVPDRPSGVTVSSTGSAGSPLARLVRAMPPSVLP